MALGSKPRVSGATKSPRARSEACRDASYDAAATKCRTFAKESKERKKGVMMKQPLGSLVLSSHVAAAARRLVESIGQKSLV